MDKTKQMKLLEDTIRKGEYLHPHKLGVDFNYIPNDFQPQPTYEDEGKIYVDKEDSVVFIYKDNTFMKIYKINKGYKLKEEIVMNKMKTAEEIVDIIKNRINKAKNDVEDSYSDMQYERAKVAQYELEELLEEILQ